MSSDPANRALTNDSLANDVTEHDPVADDDNGDAAQGAQIAPTLKRSLLHLNVAKLRVLLLDAKQGLPKPKPRPKRRHRLI